MPRSFRAARLRHPPDAGCLHFLPNLKTSRFGHTKISMKTHFAHIATFVAGFCLAGLTASAVPIPENCDIGGFALGCQAWTYKEYTVMEAIDKTAEAGG